MLMFCMDDMVPQNHMLRLIDKAIDWNFIYDLVEEKYCPDNSRQKHGSRYAHKNSRYSVSLRNKIFLHLGKTIHAVLKIPIFLNRFFPGFSKNA